MPAKLTVKKFIGDDWMVACLVPKGNMMHCMVRETEAGLKQLKYRLDRQLSLEHQTAFTDQIRQI